MTAELSRRNLLKGLGGLSLLSLIPPGQLAAALGATPGQPGRFLNARELDTLRAVTDRLLPGPPEDPDPGALQAGCAEAIDMLLGAFSVSPPLIHAGGPFSNRAGATHDDLSDFYPQDALTELGWRIRIEGSQGKPERSFNGPVTGLQEKYRKGLADLDSRASQAGAHPASVDFMSASHAAQEAILHGPDVADFVAMALGDTLAAMYGPPEYGGNRDLVGWRATNWPGDVQPRGYTDAQVSTLDAGPSPPIDAATARNALQQFIVGIKDLS